jgi:alpha-mannosidase
VDAEAETLTRPLRERTASRTAPFTLETIGPVGVEIVAVKPSEDGRGRIIRLVEKHGGHGTAILRLAKSIGTAVMCDCLERPLDPDGAIVDGNTIRVGLRPFGIVTLRVEGSV